MSLQHAAQHLASKGRGPDRTLVHMSPREVSGLQALAKAHGGSLTINPETGLAEAGFLDRLMPMIVGAGLTAATGGAAAPWMIGAGVGGLQAMRTGSLSQGLMAGLGAYGGAGLMGGVAQAGAQEVAGETVAKEAAANQAETAAAGAANTQAAQAANIGAPGVYAPPTTVPYDAATSADMSFVTPANQLPTSSYAATATPEQVAAAKANTGYGELASKGFSSLGTDTGRSAAISGMGGGAGATKTGLAALSPAMVPEAPQIPGEEKYNGPLSRYRMSDDYQSYDAAQPNPYYQAKYTDYRYAGGGPVEQMSNANSVGANTGYPMADMNQGSYATPYQTPISRNVVTGSADVGVNPLNGEMNFAGGGGISDLGGYSDGGRMLKGPGDGMSDSIPAQIGSKQPARLADGEFVVPADVVSHLGNGSTDAGAKQLYKMMDRIRQQRTGKKKQAPEVRPRKAMPA
jgi:hypothetical protein